MSAAVPSGRRITGGLLKGYFIRTSSSYPAYPHEFPAGVRKSFRHSPFYFPPPPPLLFPFSQTILLLGRKFATSQDTRAREFFRSRTPRGKWEPNTWKAVFTTRLTRSDGVLRNGKIFSTRAPICTSLLFFFFFFSSFLRATHKRGTMLWNANLISDVEWKVARRPHYSSSCRFPSFRARRRLENLPIYAFVCVCVCGVITAPIIFFSTKFLIMRELLWIILTNQRLRPAIYQDTQSLLFHLLDLLTF